MAFKSVNEISQFDFEDCRVTKIYKDSSSLVMELESLIVLENNTQNSNYTKSYADTTELTLEECTVKSITLAGYKVYDANDNLVEEVKDKPISEADFDSVLKGLSDSYLYRFIKVSDDDGYEYDFEVEKSEEGQMVDLRNDTYVVRVKFTNSIFKWERYMNRVQS